MKQKVATSLTAATKRWGPLLRMWQLFVSCVNLTKNTLVCQCFLWITLKPINRKTTELKNKTTKLIVLGFFRPLVFWSILRRVSQMKPDNGPCDRDIERRFFAFHGNLQNLAADFEDWFRQATNLVAGDQSKLRA